jgi:DNA phosphorothioation-associated putative methyltransferase
MVSYLSYPDFWENPHPPLFSSFTVNLVNQTFQYHGFAERANRPILHRKETFISKLNPKFSKFAELSSQEEKHGLFREPSTIGTEQGWNNLLTANHIRITPDHKICSGD